MKTRTKSNSQRAMLKEVRKKLGLTQAEMALYLGTTQETLSKYENGRLQLDWVDRAIKLQKLFLQAGYSIEDLAPPSEQSQSVISQEN